MYKKIIFALLVMAMCLSSIGVFAESDKALVSSTNTKVTAATDETKTDETKIVEDTTDVDTVDEGTVEEDKTDEDTEEEGTVEEDKTDEGTTEEGTVEDGEEVKVEKSKVAKDALENHKKARAEAKIEAKAFVKDLKKLFKDADTATKKEILAQIAKVKKELKDLSIGTFIKGLVVDYEKYDGVEPVIENERTLVPVRAISETLGATVDWNEETQTITITKDTNVITMQLDNKTATVNGEAIELEVAPTTRKGRTIVPIRFISESLGLTVDWDQDSQTIVID